MGNLHATMPRKTGFTERLRFLYHHRPKTSSGVGLEEARRSFTCGSSSDSSGDRAIQGSTRSTGSAGKPNVRARRSQASGLYGVLSITAAEAPQPSHERTSIRHKGRPE